MGGGTLEGGEGGREEGWGARQPSQMAFVWESLKFRITRKNKLRAQCLDGHHTNSRLEESRVESGSRGWSTIKEDGTKATESSSWNCFQSKQWGIIVRYWGAHIEFPESIDTIFNWTKLDHHLCASALTHARTKTHTHTDTHTHTYTHTHTHTCARARARANHINVNGKSSIYIRQYSVKQSWDNAQRTTVGGMSCPTGRKRKIEAFIRTVLLTLYSFSNLTFETIAISGTGCTQQL